MTLGQFYETIQTHEAWVFLQSKAAKFSPAHREQFQRSLETVIGEAYHASQEGPVAPPAPPEPKPQPPETLEVVPPDVPVVDGSAEEGAPV